MKNYNTTLTEKLKKYHHYHPENLINMNILQVKDMRDCGPFTKNKERIQKFKRYVYQNELDKTCFQHNMVYCGFKDFLRRTGSHKVLRDNAFNIARNVKLDEYERGLAFMVYKFFDKKTSGANTLGDGVKNETIPDQELVEELHKTI